MPASARETSGAAPGRPLLQTTFLAPEDATLLADLSRLRGLVAELTGRYCPSAAAASGGDAHSIRSPRDVANLLAAEMEGLPQEQLRVLVLNSKHVVLDVVTVYQGTLTAAPVRAAEVFRPAVVASGASVVVVHSHPSGAPRSA
ncbi:MAG: JAB domain-containing protein [Chloroflexota bacterium]